jgi:predicted TPR repeat methyltransferase
LFDSCSDEFDSRLVDTLKYQVPQLLYDAVCKYSDSCTRKLDILDMGCGTGLCGVAFSEVINSMVGVDLAPRMLEKAGERGVYTELIRADVCQALEQCTQSFDLVLSADVFVYIGDLKKVFDLTARRLIPGGLFAFTIEVDNRIQDFELRSTGRYVQSFDYIHRLAEVCGFEEICCLPISGRNERGKPVSGGLVILRLTA